MQRRTACIARITTKTVSALCFFLAVTAGTFVVSATNVGAATFTHPLVIGSTGSEVTALQQILQSKGYLTLPLDSTGSPQATGYFGPLTAKALASFQTANGIEALGGVGPKTRTLLNSLSSSSSNPNQTLIDALLAEVKILEAKIAALLAARATTSGGGGFTVTNYTPPASGGGGGGGGGGTSPSPSPTPTPSPTPSPTPMPLPDTTPPSVTITSPSGNLSAGTTQTSLAVTTNENATCRYSTNTAFTFSAGTLFITTGNLSHSTTLSPLANGTSYTYYVKCADSSNNISSNASVTFTVASPAPPLTPTPTPTPTPAPSPSPAPSGGGTTVNTQHGYDWKTLKIGGGGLLSGMDIAPDGTTVVRTDTYGAYLWTGSQWQQLVTTASIPSALWSIGEGVYEIRIAPNNSNILYMMYGGYVLKSINKGTTWTQTSFAKVSENPNSSIRGDGEHIAVDPINANVVYVGTPQNGLFVTQDGGATWQNVGAVPISLKVGNGDYPGITGIALDPAIGGSSGGKTNIIFASSYGNGVYESTNAGASWTKLTGGPTNVEHAAVSTTGVYYVVGNDNSSIWYYASGAWTQAVTAASINGQYVAAVAVNPLNPSQVVFANGGGNLDFSVDAGHTWSGIYFIQSLSSPDIPWLASGGGSSGYLSIGNIIFSPIVSGQLFGSSGIGVWDVNLPTNSFPSSNITWNDQTVGIEQLVANELVVPPGGKPVVASWDRPFFYINNPDTFPTSYGPSGGSFAAGWSVDYASSNPTFLAGVANWWGAEQSSYSTNGGQTWTAFVSYPPFGGQTIGGSIAVSSPTNIVWAAANGFQPYYTTNGGTIWTPVTLPGISSFTNFDTNYGFNMHTVVADRVLPNTFYLYDADTGSASAGFFKSTNGGVTWTKVFSGQLSPFSYFSAQLESVPGQAGNIFFTGGPQANLPSEQFMRTTDGGATWTAVQNVTQVYRFGFGKSATANGYPAIYIAGFVNTVYGLWRSDDNAATWIQIADYPNNSLDGIRTISGDMNQYGSVYVGFSGSGYAYGNISGTVVTPPAPPPSPPTPAPSPTPPPPVDTTPPTITITAPSGTLAANTAQVNISATTNESATCAYSTASGTAFASMTQFTTTGNTSHATTISGLTNGTSYTFYVKCKDTAGNISIDSSTSFSVASSAGGGGNTCSATPALDGAVQASSGYASRLAVNLSTTKPNDVIELVMFVYFGSLTSVSSPSLTWHLRSSFDDGGGHQVFEYYAIAPTPLSSETITASLNGATTIPLMTAFGVNGANTASPFDGNSLLPRTASGGADVLLSASNANDFIFAGYSDYTNAGSAGPGWSSIGNSSYMILENKIISSPQTNLDATVTGDTTFLGIGDALRCAP